MKTNTAPTTAAYSVDGFCQAHGIGRNLLYREWKEGRGPRYFNIGRRRLISAEAAAEYRQQLEQETERGAA